jgi:hypothetical protein
MYFTILAGDEEKAYSLFYKYNLLLSIIRSKPGSRIVLNQTPNIPFPQVLGSFSYLSF